MKLGYSIGLCLLLVLSKPLHAMPMLFDFSYELRTGEVLSGLFEGELQPDGDTVFISDILAVTFSGAPDLVLHTELFRNVATLSGIGNALTTLAPTPERAGFVIPFQFSGQDLVAISLFDNFTFRIDAYSPDRWRLTPRANAVPALSPACLILLGLALLRWRRC